MDWNNLQNQVANLSLYGELFSDLMFVAQALRIVKM